MPNIKSAMKRAETSKERNAKNKANRSALKTVLKKFEAAAAGGSREEAEATYKVAVKTVDRAVSKGLLHQNNAAHKKSGMTHVLNELSK
jgi:small subunit ribosomal protein S20